MAKIHFLGNLVGIEKASTQSKKKKDDDSLFIREPEVADDYGTVRYIGANVKDPAFKVGDKVYFGRERQELRMSGQDILVMKVENVVALVEEEESSEEAPPAA